MSLRALLYRTARLLGDIHAARRGRLRVHIAHRLEGRALGRLAGALARRLFR